MATLNMETRNGTSPVPQTQEGGSEAPSGFILKLFQMVNGAPDEVICVSRLLPTPATETICEPLATQKETNATLHVYPWVKLIYVSIALYSSPSFYRVVKSWVIIGQCSLGDFRYCISAYSSISGLYERITRF